MTSTTLADAVKNAFAQATRVWPTVHVDPSDFERHVRARVAEGLIAEDLARVSTDDLYVACGCVLRVLGAVDAVIDAHGALLQHQVRLIETRADVARDVLQSLHVELLVGGKGGAPPKIVEYSGRGPLRAWLRMAASRRALNARRDVKRFSPLEAHDEAAILGTTADPELEYVKSAYPAAFAVALRRAVADGSREDRALLRLHYIDGVTMDGLAALHGWSRASAHRRLATARAAVLTRMEQTLLQELRLAPEELQSLLRAVRSRIHVSLADALALGNASGSANGSTGDGNSDKT